ncbi:MAG: hypothetical protein ABII06_19550, partial [Pseudomonadota bacterium]
MKRRKYVHLILSLVLLILIPSMTFSQTEQGGEGAPEKSALAGEFDKKALGKLKEMTPAEVEELDRKLAEALTLLYDKDFARALPIFREISDRVETMDILFWS